MRGLEGATERHMHRLLVIAAQGQRLNQRTLELGSRLRQEEGSWRSETGRHDAADAKIVSRQIKTETKQKMTHD